MKWQTWDQTKQQKTTCFLFFASSGSILGMNRKQESPACPSGGAAYNAAGAQQLIANLRCGGREIAWRQMILKFAIINFIGVFHYKPSILGVKSPYFWFNTHMMKDLNKNINWMN